MTEIVSSAPFASTLRSALNVALFSGGLSAVVLASGCEQGTTDPIEPYPELAAVDEWLAPSPDEAPASTPVAMHGQLRVDGLNLVDESGEPVQLRGVSSMWLNWDTKGFGTSKEGMQWMRDEWGISLFRAAVAVEEDAGYLKDPGTMTRKAQRIIQNAIDLGVYVLIDWHDHNANLHPEAAEEFFSRMAAEFGEYPNVIYETFNEPTKVTWSDDLKPYHERVVKVIREQDPDGVAILGTVQWSQRVDQAAEDPVDLDNIMYTLHFYACDSFHQQPLRDIADTALSLGAPLFVTEWGATTSDGGVADKQVCADEALAWHEWMKTNNISWAAWKLDACTDASCFFKPGTSNAGGWTGDALQGHGPFVVEQLRQAAGLEP